MTTKRKAVQYDNYQMPDGSSITVTVFSDQSRLIVQNRMLPSGLIQSKHLEQLPLNAKLVNIVQVGQ